MMKTNQSRAYRFGAFEANGATGELRRQGLRVRLHDQPFALLMLLVERAGELVTREEIAARLWPEGTFVDFERGVNSAINRLRVALGDTAASPRYVETLARKGYRFVAPVERLGVDEAAELPGDGGFGAKILARPEDLPAAPRGLVQVLYLLLCLPVFYLHRPEKYSCFLFLSAFRLLSLVYYILYTPGTWVSGGKEISVTMPIFGGLFMGYYLLS